jgi:hypothetical protein
MSKKSRDAIRSNLAKVLEPPPPPVARRRGANLDGLLNEYAPPDQAPEHAQSPAPTPEIPRAAESPAESAAPETIAAPAESASQANDLLAGRQIAAPAESASPAINAAHVSRPQADLLAGLPQVRGYLRLYYQLIDHLLPQLSPAEAVVYLHLYRLSWGFNNSTCLISNPGLARRAGISERSVRDVTGRLVEKKLVEKVDEVFGAGKEQGIKYRVAIPAGLETVAGPANSAGAAGSADNKEKAFKDKSKKGSNRLTPEEIQSFTATVADLLREGEPPEKVESRFAPTMHPVDWATIRSTALAQAGVKQ